MLQLNPGLMATMDDRQLIAGLLAEGLLVSAELELIRRLEAALDREVDKSVIVVRIGNAITEYPGEDCLETILEHPDCSEALSQIVMAEEVKLIEAATRGIFELEQTLDHIGEDE